MITGLVNDLTIKNNLAQACTMAVLYPLLKDELEYKQRVAKYKAQVTIPSRLDTLEKRMLALEKRQVLAEADLALLRGQLELESVRV